MSAASGRTPIARRERRSTERASRRAHGAPARSIWRGPLPYVVSLVVIGGAIGWSVLSRGAPAGSPAPAEAGAVIAKVATIPATVFDQVGTGGLTDAVRATTFAELRGASGKPVVIYVGADFCPFCASQRWSLVAALSRFGTFRDLALTRSSSTDVYPDTATLTFRGASYASDLVELSAVETADRDGRPTAPTTPLQDSAMARSDPAGSIPFLSVAERYVRVGSGYSPDVLAGKGWGEIAAALSDPASPIAKAVLGNANYMTAAICRTTGGKPSQVCDSPAVRAIPLR